MGTKSVTRMLAVLKLPKKNTPLYVAMATVMVERMTGNPFFPDPDPPLAEVSAAIQALNDAQVATLSRTNGTVADRNAKRKIVQTMLESLRAYVQHCADADPDHAASIIESAGMSVQKTRRYPPRGFAAKPGANSGTVILLAPRAGRNVGYEWAYRKVGAMTWILVPYTVNATTTITGLTPGDMMECRYRVTTKDGPGNWSDAIQFMAE